MKKVQSNFFNKSRSFVLLLSAICIFSTVCEAEEKDQKITCHYSLKIKGEQVGKIDATRSRLLGAQVG